MFGDAPGRKALAVVGRRWPGRRVTSCPAGTPAAGGPGVPSTWPGDNAITGSTATPCERRQATLQEHLCPSWACWLLPRPGRCRRVPGPFPPSRSATRDAVICQIRGNPLGDGQRRLGFVLVKAGQVFQR